MIYGTYMGLKKKKTTKWEDFKFWILLKKTALYIKWISIKKSFIRRRHCDKGFHLFESDHIHITMRGAGYKSQWSRRTDFLRCRICGLLAFTTKKDKNNYITIKRREQKTMDKAIKLMTKDLNNNKSKK